MLRYQIIYIKDWLPIVHWAEDKETARKFAAQMRSVGYSVDVWEHKANTARKIEL